MTDEEILDKIKDNKFKESIEDEVSDIFSFT